MSGAFFDPQHDKADNVQASVPVCCFRVPRVMSIAAHSQWTPCVVPAGALKFFKTVRWPTQSRLGYATCMPERPDVWKRPGFYFPKCRDVGMKHVWLCLPTCTDVAPSCHATRPRCVGTWRDVTWMRFFTWKPLRQQLQSPRESAAFRLLHCLLQAFYEPLLMNCKLVLLC